MSQKMISINMDVRIFFDLDGVLADMETGLMNNPDVAKLRTELDNLIESDFPEYKNLVDDDIKSKFKKELEINPQSGVKSLKKAFNNYTSKVFSTASKPGFYFNLPLMPGAVEMVRKANELVGKKSHILSSPVGDETDPNNPSVQEKKDWVKKHFGDHIDQIIITSDKGKVVEGKSDILIDDRPKYVEKFTSAGGTAILHKEWTDSISKLQQILKSFESKRIMTFESFLRNIKSFQLFETAFEPTLRTISREMENFVEVRRGGSEPRLFVKSGRESDYESSRSSRNIARSNNDTIMMVDEDTLFIYDYGDLFGRADLKVVLDQFKRMFGLSQSRVIYYDSQGNTKYL